MADAKISALPAGTAVQPADLLVAVQSGVTNKVTGAQVGPVGFATDLGSGGTTTLSVTSARVRYRTTANAAWTYTLPAATTLYVGDSFIFVNDNTASATVNNNGGSNIAVVAGKTAVQIWCTSIASANGTWVKSTVPATSGAYTVVLRNSDGTFNQGTINTSAGSAAINLSNNQLINGGAISLDWAAKTTYDDDSFESLNWQDRSLVNSLGDTSLNWDAYQAYDTGSNPSLSWQDRTLIDSNSSNSLEWENRQLVNSGSTATCDWENGTLSDGDGTASLRWIDRQGNDVDNVKSYSWGERNCTSAPDEDVVAGWADDCWRVYHLGSGFSRGGAISISAGTGAGTSPTVSMKSGSNDVCGVINVTTGTTPAGTNATIGTVTFEHTFNAAPVVVLTPANAITATLTGLTGIYVDDSATTTAHFLIKSGTTGLTGAATYKWMYHIIEPSF